MELVLHTERLILRPLQPEDVDLALEMFTDPLVVRYVCVPTKPDDIRAEMTNKVKRCGGGCIGIWCVLDRTTSEKLGTCILLPMPIEEDDINWDLVEGPDIPDAEIEIGYILKRSAWGKGYATEVCKRLLAFAFEQTPLQEIVASVDDDNVNSRSVLYKAGLQDDGRRLAYGEQSLCFRITRQQWLAMQQQNQLRSSD